MVEAKADLGNEPGAGKGDCLREREGRVPRSERLWTAVRVHLKFLAAAIYFAAPT